MVSILLGLQFPLLDSLAKIGERRPLRKGERQSGYSCVCFVKYSQFTDSVLLHMWFTLRRRDIPVSRNSFARYYGRHLRILSNDECSTVGCDDSAHRIKRLLHAIP